MRRSFILAGAAAAMVLGLVVTALVLTQRPDKVASIDGHPVTRDELIFHMRRLAPAVQNELHVAGWTGKDARRRLAARALDEIRRDKTTLILAKEQGLVDSDDHADFLADLAAENERRAKALARGETVYGLTEFSPDEYYSHRLTELTTTLKQRLSAAPGAPLRVTDTDVRRAFDADRDAWSANATTYRYSRLVVPVPGDSADYAAGLQRRVATARRLADVAAREPGSTLTTATYAGGVSNGQSVQSQDLMAVLSRLAPGQISTPVPGTGLITYYQLDGKTVDERGAFAAYSGRIRQSLIEERFEQYLQRRVDDSDIEVDTAAVDAINAEDLQQ
jgi:hypothetical protein